MTRVLVVDDSALMRRQLRSILEDHGGFEVVTARNGADALAQVDQLDPDVVTLDINMPEMDGLTCLAELMETSPRPVVMVSSLTTRGALATFEALQLGAVDYAAKPGGTVSLNLEEQADEIVQKVRVASRARVPAGRRRARGARPAAPPAPARPPARPRARRTELVLIGASTGGPGVLPDILSALPAGFSAPIVIAQHIPAAFSGPLAARLDQECAIRVVEAGSPEVLEPGVAVVGRGEADVVVAQRGGRPMVRSVPRDPALRWHPSVERLVRSATEHFDPRGLVGVMLTGMGDDGATAMTELRRRGGRTMAESEESAVVWGMPGSLVQAGGADEVLPASRVAERLLEWVPWRS